MAGRKVKHRLLVSLISTLTSVRLPLKDKGSACASASGVVAITAAMRSLPGNRSGHRRTLPCA